MFSISRHAASASIALRSLRLQAVNNARLVSSTLLRLSSTATDRQLDEGEQAIHDKLRTRFSPSQLQVQDVSGGCGTFYAITISSAAFKGLPMVKQHRLVTEELKKEIAGIHGLQIKTIPE